MSYFNLNGNIIPLEQSLGSAHLTSPSQQHGIFETILFQSGNINLEDYHFERLFTGLKLLNFNIDSSFTPSFVKEEIIRTVTRNHLLVLCRVRLKVFTEDPSQLMPHYSIECFELPPELTSYNKQGLTVGVAPGATKPIGALSATKQIGSQVYASAMQQAIGNSRDDALIRNNKNNIIESSIANIFWVSNNIIHTPPLSEGCVAGIMRRYLIEQLPSKGVTCIESELTDETLSRANEVFLTNAIRRIKWVEQIGTNKYNNALSSEISSLLFP